MYVCSRGIDFAGFYDFSVGFGTVPTVWYFFLYTLYANT
jgi:hypothetical protein